MKADSQPLPRQFVSDVSIKRFEDELTDAKSQSPFVSQCKDTMKDYIDSLVGPVEDWPRQRAFLDYFASKMEFLQKPEVTPERTAIGLRGEGGVVTSFHQTLSGGGGRVVSSHHSSRGCQEECCDDTPCSSQLREESCDDNPPSSLPPRGECCDDNTSILLLAPLGCVL